MRNRAYFLVWTFILLGQCSSFAFVSQRKSSLIFARTGRLTSFGRRRPTRTTRLTMRDASSAYWFAKGDTVQVVQDVIKANYSLKDRTGTVVETWEKCDVDPTCCCAEQVDQGMAVRVEFPGSEESPQADGSFLHYFAEEELEKVVIEQTQQAFHGLSCKAFKLDQLQMGEQARRIAAFEASRQGEEGQ